MSRFNLTFADYVRHLEFRQQTSDALNDFIAQGDHPGAHVRAICIRHFDAATGSPDGYNSTVYAIFNGYGERITPAFWHAADAATWAIYYRLDYFDAQDLRWSDAMAAAAGKQNYIKGEKALAESEAEVRNAIASIRIIPGVVWATRDYQQVALLEKIVDEHITSRMLGHWDRFGASAAFERRDKRLAK